VILTCSAEPTDVVIQWMFNGQALTDTTHRRGRSHNDNDNDNDDDDSMEVVIRRRGFSTHQLRNEHSLHIGAFDVSRHEGVFQCLATSTSGSLLSSPATLEPAGRISHCTLFHSKHYNQKGTASSYFRVLEHKTRPEI